MKLIKYPSQFRDLEFDISGDVVCEIIGVERLEEYNISDDNIKKCFEKSIF